MQRFRLRLSNGEVLGPIKLNELKDLVREGKLDERCFIQKVGEKSWMSIWEMDEVRSLLENASLSGTETHLLNLKNLDLSQPDTEVKNIEEKKEEVKEFKFEHKDPFESEIDTSDDEEKSKDSDDKTLIKKIDSKNKSNNLDKTVLNKDYQAYLKRLEEEKKENERKDESASKSEEVIPDYENEATQMITISDIEIEDYDEPENDDKTKIIKKKKKTQKIEEKKEVDKTNSQKKDFKKIRKKLVVGLIVVLSIFILFSEENSDTQKLSKIKLIEPFIRFPTRYDIPDIDKAKTFYKNGLKKYQIETYPSFVEASKSFFKSAENNFQENKALAYLIFLYSDNLINSNDYTNDANSIFKLVQIFRRKGVSDPIFASAISYFYLQIGKVDASLQTFDKYFILNPKLATPQLFAVRLKALIKAGILDEAKKVSNKLETVSNKSLFVIKALYEYYKIQQEIPKMLSLLEEASKKYKDNAYVLIEKGLLFVEQQAFSDLKEIIHKLNKINVEGSKYYYSKYLYLKGMYFASLKRPNLAAIEFKKSLDLFESIDLLSKLALLSESTDTNVNDLILDSRAKKFLHEAKIKFDEGDLKGAFKLALQASDIRPNSIKIRLFLSQLQMKRGYIEDAINQLDELYKDNPSSTDILFSLIDAYIEAFKFKKVLSLLNTAQNISGGQEDQYLSAKAKYSIYRGEYNAGLGWLQRAINENPLNDKNIHELAKLYIKYHKYDRAKSILNRAMDLDPANVDYRISFAKILYELETSEAAVGYLYDVLKDFPDNPKILSTIGIYFYRSGQLKKYKNVKKKLLALPKKDKSLYEFLIESARLDDDVEKVIENSERLIELDPGDLKVRMKLAGLLIDLQRYKEAKKQLDDISERLSTYPRLQYLYAKLYFLIDDLDKAKSLAKKEIKENPTVVDGYILLGNIYIKEKDLIKARKQYVKAVQVSPNNIDAILGIAYVAFHTDQYDMALDQYQKALEIDSNRAEIYKLLGDAYRKLGQSQLAIKNYKHFLELSPNTKYKNSIEKYIRTMQ